LLSRLFSSRLRVEILALLFNNPKERFYLRQVARLIGKNAAGVKRELDNLYRMDVVNAEREGNLKYYSVNTGCYLFPELRSLIVKALGVEGSLRSVLQAAPTIRAAFLYGPAAEGSAAEVIDLLLVGTLTPDLDARLADLERKLGRAIRCTVVDENRYRDWCSRKDRPMAEFLSGPRVVLKGNP